MSVLVPNRFPTVDPSSIRLACIGEAPGSDEVRALDRLGNSAPEPFVGAAGKFLRSTLASCGTSVDQTFLGNICQVNPPYNDIERFPWEGPEIQSGLDQLKLDLLSFRPNCLLLLGRTALRAARPDLCYPTKGGKYHIPLADWRGSVFTAGTLGGFKAVGTYHPAHILRSYNDKPFFTFDVARAVRQATNPALVVTPRNGVLRPTLGQVVEYLTLARLHRIPQTLDIEGYPDNVGITMLSMCPTSDPSTGLVIPFWLSGGHYWTEDEEVEVWQELALTLADENIPKTVHAGFYELFVFAWRHKTIINNIADDTMFAHWELYPDFAKGDREEKQKVSATQKKRSLGVCASLYTLQPFYKDDRLSNDTEVKLNYSFLDSSVTAEVRNVAVAQLLRVPPSYEHYRFNINLIPAYNYIMLRGCRLDVNKMRDLTASVTSEIDDLNRQVNLELESRGVFGSFPVSKADEKHRSRDGFNVKSTKQKQWLLYDHLQFTPLKKYETETGGNGTDEDCLLHYWKKTSDPLLRLVIRCIRKRTRLSDIHKLLPDADGRIRTAYDLVGTNTGRLSSRSSMSMVFSPEDGWVNAGTNLQNVTKELRVCFIPDSEDFDFWQFDLSGADGWTVAAELAALGFPKMLEDYSAGIKPSIVLYHMLREHAAGRSPHAVNTLSTPEVKRINDDLKRLIKSLEGKNDSEGRPAEWQYTCCKRVQHGSNYDMQEERTSELVFGDSDGTIILTPKDAKFYQSLYKQRYRTDARNNWIRETLAKTGCIVSSCGIRRQFFAIRSRSDIDDEIVRQASSFNPQANTTYVTNKTLEKLWFDRTNRTSKGGLFVEPLLQTHDAFAGQNRNINRDWSHGKLKEWFINPVKIAGQMITIPAEGHYGPNWRDGKEDIK